MNYPTPSELANMTPEERLAWDIVQSFELNLTIHDFGYLVIKIKRLSDAYKMMMDSVTMASHPPKAWKYPDNRGD